MKMSSSQQTRCKTHVIVARAPVFHPSFTYKCVGWESGEESRLALQPSRVSFLLMVCLPLWLIVTSLSTDHNQTPHLDTWEAELQFSPLRDNKCKGNRTSQKHEKILCFYTKYSFCCSRRHQCLLDYFIPLHLGKRPCKITAFTHQNNSWWKYQR